MDISPTDATSDSTACAAVKQQAALRWVTHGCDSLKELWRSWYAFWFTPADPFTLGIIRILTGWMLVYNLLVWGSDLQSFFGWNSLQPLHAILELHQDDPVFSFWYYVPESWITTTHWTCVAIAVMFFLGIGTRVTSVAAYLITISYSQRVPVANFGLDQILGLLCLYLAIGPSGACLSVDAWWKRRRIRAAGATMPEIRSSSAQIALRLIQLHLCVIYFWAGFAKLKGDSWWTGEAMWQVMANMEYQTLDLTWMANIPWLPYLIAHVTVAWEVFFCVLIWNRRLRPLILLIGTGMHFGIGAFLGMWTFGLIMTYAYFSFSDPAAWRRRLSWILPAEEISLLEADATNLQPEAFRPQLRSVSTCLAESTEAQLAPPVDLSGVENAQGSQRLPSKLTASSSKSLRSELTGAVDADPTADGSLHSHDAALLLLSMHAEERATLRQYFRRHDIPCRAVTTPETALSLVIPLAPAVIVISGSRLSPRRVGELIDDLQDVSDAPIVAVLSVSQYNALEDRELPVEVIIYPASPRQIRETITRLIFGAAKPTSQQTQHRKISSESPDREVTSR